MFSAPANSSRSLTPHKLGEPVLTETSHGRHQYGHKLRHDIGKYCEQADGAIMNSNYKANLLLRISIFFKELATVIVDNTEIENVKACCGMLALVRYFCALLRFGQASLC